MDVGLSFLRSKTARRFLILFILCAFIPTVTLVVLSYSRVVSQLEKQSQIRLKREAKAYGLSLFDRMIRINIELRTIGRDFSKNQTADITISANHKNDLESIFLAIGIYSNSDKWRSLHKFFDPAPIEKYLTKAIFENKKPFILTSVGDALPSSVFFGVNIQEPGEDPYTVVAEIKPEYLWGIGPAPILPPLTELWVYNRTGTSIVSSHLPIPNNYKDLQKQIIRKDRNTFQFNIHGKEFLASTSNLFLNSRFQDTDWVIIIGMAKEDIMSAMDNFKRTFPAVILLFLLLILYFSIFFIRSSLDPLEKLKEGTKRIANKDFSASVTIQTNDEFQDLGDSFNSMASQLDKQFSTLTVLNEINRAILSSYDSETILSTTLQSLKDFFHCDITIFAENSPAITNNVKMSTLEERRIDGPCIRFSILSKDEKQKIFAEYNSLTLEAGHDIPFFLKENHGTKFSQYIILPLSIENKINRIVILGWREKTPLKDDELSQARLIADQLATALTNSDLLVNMKNLAMGTIDALARTVDAKSKWTSGHSERVAKLAGQTAKAMGLSANDIDTIIRGGLLHDIGKIGIPVAILNKTGKLTDDEYTEIQTHPEIGSKILEPIMVYQNILPLVKHHHERFDGTGYPDGLKKDEIDLTARIMAVADVWDALVSDRPYRDGWVHDRAKRLLIEKSGSHFDPEIVKVFLTVIEES